MRSGRVRSRCLTACIIASDRATSICSAHSFSPQPTDKSFLRYLSVQGLPQQRRPPLCCMLLPATAAASGRRGAPAHGAASACAPCGWRVVAGFPCGGGSLAPRRSKDAPKTGDHGGIMHQPERDRSILTTTAIQPALGNGHRALRAPASPSVASAGSQTPGAKSGGGSLLLSRERSSRRLPQPAARAAAASGDNAGGDGGLAQDSRGTPWQSAGEQRRRPALVPRREERLSEASS